MVHVARGRLSVDVRLAEFMESEALPSSPLDANAFWLGVEKIVDRFGPQIRASLAERDRHAIDAWHRDHPGSPDPASYRAFLRKIGYLLAPTEDVRVTTTGVDDEIAALAGPQLVVPVSNARYALNAVNARWGSLYDALYGTDAIPGRPASGEYDVERGAAVVPGCGSFSTPSFPWRMAPIAMRRPILSPMALFRCASPTAGPAWDRRDPTTQRGPGLSHP